ncbi:MAG: YggS family pyridoxal phosphate-dependent enzyme [Caryophanon sp.]|nr:YggS family pyridoxal phosphate-dependent enzyme [Caryophanon sp.]
MTTITNNLQAIEAKMKAACERAGRSMDDVTCIAVTKSVTVERTAEALEAGITHLGENRPEGLLLKQQHVTDERAVWHYIGSLQTRKVKQVVNDVDYIHSLDRLSLAEEIEKRATGVVKCFVQVNVSGEQSKHGLSPEEVQPFLQQLQAFSHIEVVGLMTMAPNTEDEQIIRGVFRRLKELQQQLQALQLPAAPCHELSMGMSGDFDIAIEEGATFVRIGTALVG